MAASTAAVAATAAMHVLLISIEFSQSTVFSGNGVLARSLAIALGQQQMGAAASSSSAESGGLNRKVGAVDVDVLCAVPVLTDGDADGSGSGPLDVATDASGRVKSIGVPVPQSQWKRLDRASAWQAFADAVGRERSAILAAAGVTSLADYDAVLYVDYTGGVAFAKLASAEEAATLKRTGRLHFANFRVFSASVAVPPADPKRRDHITAVARVPLAWVEVAAGGGSARSPSWWHLATSSDEDRQQSGQEAFALTDWEFYALAEGHAIAMASTAFALCVADIEELKATSSAVGFGDALATLRAFDVLVPPIRQDMWLLGNESVALGLSSARPGDGGSADSPSSVAELMRVLGRVAPASTDTIASVDWSRAALVTCVVRMDPAKEAHRLVHVVKALLHAQRQDPDAHPRPLVLFVAGAASSAEYKSRLLGDLCDLDGAVVIVAETFLDAPTMALVYRHTALNVHPCRYDAYGMTVVEAAAFRVPSVVHFPRAGKGATRVGCAAQLLTAPTDVVRVDLEEFESFAGRVDDDASPSVVPRMVAAVARAVLGSGNGNEESSTLEAPGESFADTAGIRRQQTALGYKEQDLASRILRHFAAHRSDGGGGGALSDRTLDL